ncbi:MAG: flagellar filament capping protein FliD [Kofleriaceae bacterium]
MSAITFSGISSGLDTSSLITQLVAAEKSSEDTYTSQQQTISNQKSVVDSLKTATASLGTLASDMKLASSLAMRTATASDSHLSVAVSGTADTGTHTVRVNTVAVAQVQTSNTFSSSSTAGVAGSGTLTIGVGTNTASISYDSTDSLTSIASKINGASAGVTASVLYDGTNYRLVVNSKDTGTANAAKFTDTGTALGLSSSANITVPAQDASLTVDGVTVTRSKNVIDDALPGVTLTVNSAAAATEAATNVSVSNDVTSLTSKLQEFVTDYNNVMGALNTQLTYNANASSQSVLFGDSTLRQMQSTLRGMMTNKFSGMGIDDLGLSLDDDGMMSLDTSKLSTKLSTSPNAISDFFATGGFGQAVQSMSDSYTETGDGILVTKEASYDDQTKMLQDTIDRIDTNADALKDRLQKQFDALETAESKWKTYGNYLTSLFSSSSSS